MYSGKMDKVIVGNITAIFNPNRQNCGFTHAPAFMRKGFIIAPFRCNRLIVLKFVSLCGCSNICMDTYRVVSLIYAKSLGLRCYSELLAWAKSQAIRHIGTN